MKLKVTDLLQKMSFIFDEDFLSIKEAECFLEEKVEEDFLTLFEAVGITATTKQSDKKSLPVHGSLGVVKGFVSYLNDSFSYPNLNRDVLREILVGGHGKIRFYVNVEFRLDEEGNARNVFVEFNYYVHNK
jgi:hypothetical protein